MTHSSYFMFHILFVLYLTPYFLYCTAQDIGGPDEGMSMKQQGDLIFEILDKKPAFWAAPISLFDAIIGGLSFFGKWFDGAEDAAELARIGKLTSGMRDTVQWCFSA
jgi:hypothetical protein